MIFMAIWNFRHTRNAIHFSSQQKKRKKKNEMKNAKCGDYMYTILFVIPNIKIVFFGIAFYYCFFSFLYLIQKSACSIIFSNQYAIQYYINSIIYEFLRCNDSYLNRSFQNNSNFPFIFCFFFFAVIIDFLFFLVFYSKYYILNVCSYLY